jgi:hypothetical protein
LPSPPVAVTVSVTISDGTDCPAFGTLTFTPMTLDEYHHAQLICRIRQLVVTSAIFRKAIEGVREGNRWFVDPLWDPIKGYVGPGLDRAQVRRIAHDAHAVFELAESLLARRDESFKR